MRWLTLTLLVACLAPMSQAHHPDRAHKRIWPRIDLIPPLGNHLPMEYRRRFNRPTKIGGWIAYHIAPSSQEAMAWHDATHQRAYVDHRPRLEKHFFYLKPWEGLKTGPRISTIEESDDRNGGRATTEALREALDAEDDVLSASDDLPSASELLEEERYERKGQELVPPVVQPPAAQPPSLEPQLTDPSGTSL